MTRQQIFPVALILLNLGAAMWCTGWRLVVFYLSVAAINLVTAF